MVWGIVPDVRFWRARRDIPPRCLEQVRAICAEIAADPDANDGRVPELLRKRYPNCMKRRTKPPCAYVIFFRILREEGAIVLVDVWKPPAM